MASGLGNRHRVPQPFRSAAVPPTRWQDSPGQLVQALLWSPSRGSSKVIPRCTRQALWTRSQGLITASRSVKSLPSSWPCTSRNAFPGASPQAGVFAASYLSSLYSSPPPRKGINGGQQGHAATGQGAGVPRSPAAEESGEDGAGAWQRSLHTLRTHLQGQAQDLNATRPGTGLHSYRSPLPGLFSFAML